MTAINIKWDVDYDADNIELPTEIYIPEGMTDEDEISDYLSEVTGFCHEGFELVPTFKIPVRWTVWDEVEIPANSLEEALKYFLKYQDEIPLGTEPKYLDGSYELDFIQDIPEKDRSNVKVLSEYLRENYYETFWEWLKLSMKDGSFAMIIFWRFAYADFFKKYFEKASQDSIFLYTTNYKGVMKLTSDLNFSLVDLESSKAKNVKSSICPIMVLPENTTVELLNTEK